LLSEDIRQSIWDIEHLCFVIEQKVLPAWKKAIADNDRESLLAFLAEGFTADVPTDPWLCDFSCEPLRSFSWERSDENVRTVDSNAFVDEL
jgi:hypothetical protein